MKCMILRLRSFVCLPGFVRVGARWKAWSGFCRGRYIMWIAMSMFKFRVRRLLLVYTHRQAQRQPNLGTAW